MKIVNLTGRVCGHGSLKRQCIFCEQTEQSKAADALAKAVKANQFEAVYEALAAYEKVKERMRGTGSERRPFQ